MKPRPSRFQPFSVSAFQNLLLGSSLLAASAMAQVTLNTNDASGSSSYNAAGNWSDGLAPSAAKDYATSFILRAPATTSANQNFTFAGKSLSLNSGGNLVWVGSTGNPNGILTVNNLILNGGSIAVFRANSTLTMKGNISVTAASNLNLGSTGDTTQTRNIILDSTLTGSSQLRMNAQLNTANTLTVNGNNSGFSGGFLLTGTAGSVSSILNVGHVNALGTGTVTVNQGILNLNGFSVTVGGLAGTNVTGNSVQNNSNTAATLTVSSGSNTSYAGVISDGTGTGNLGLFKSGEGTLILSNTNTYTGGTTISGGTLEVQGSIAGSSGITNNAALVFNSGSAQSYANAIGGDGTLTKDGAGTLTLSGANNYTGTTTISNGTLQIGNAGTTGTLGSGAVSNAGTLVFNRTNTYTLASGNLVTGAGAVTLANTGAVATAVDGQFNTSGALNFGAAAASTTVSSLDLTNGSSTFGAMAVRTNSSTANTITIGSGKTLQNNGSVSIGANTAAGVVTSLTVSGATAGAGTWNVTSSGGSFTLGQATGGTNTNAVTLDMSTLGNFNANLDSTGTFRVGDNNTASASGTSSATLAVNSTITAGAVGIGDRTGPSGVHRLKLGSGTQTINADTISIGLNVNEFKRSSGSLEFNGENGTLKIRAADGTGAAALNMFVSNTGTGSNTSATFNSAGHSADLLFSTVDMMNTSQTSTSGGNHSATFTFDSGTLDATNFRIGTRAAVATAATNTATVFIGQTAIGTSANLTNTANLGTVTMATVSSTVGTMNGALNIGGTNTSVGITSLTVANNNASATGGTASGIVTISGGATTLTNGITLAAQTTAGAAVSGSLILNGGTLTLGSAGITTSVVGSSGVTTNLTLNGGTLDMNGRAIGASGTGAITFNAQAGELRNVASINDSGGLTKTTAGTLVLSGSNTYSGATTVSAGTLYVSGALSNSAVTVKANGAIGRNDLTGGGGILGNGLTLEAGGNLDLTGATLGLNSTGILSLTTGSSLTLGNLTFGDLVGWNWANADEGTYKLIDGDFTINWGSTAYLSAATAYDFNNGKKGYFTSGSLNVVIIPEPRAALLGGIGMLLLLRRRRH